MGLGVTCAYWLLIAVGSTLIFARELELEGAANRLLGWPSARCHWVCLTISRLLFTGAGSNVCSRARYAFSDD
jgi:hypothetical protein